MTLQPQRVERLVRITSERDSTGPATAFTRIDFKVVVDPLSLLNFLIMALRPDRQHSADMCRHDRLD